MLLKNNRKTNDTQLNDFMKFKNEFIKSGKNPQEVLNNLIKSGKVDKKQLSEIINKANSLRFLFGV